MTKIDKREVWQRGAVKNIPSLLQPVAHTLLQAGEEVNEIVSKFPEAYLWERIAGVASVGFHLQHLSGVLDRLFTYARGEALNEEQLKELSEEGKAIEGKNGLSSLVALFNGRINKALAQLSATDVNALAEPRMVGRAKIPSTMIGLLFHAAEHTMRHVGQLYVTVKVTKDRFRTGL